MARRSVWLPVLPPAFALASLLLACGGGGGGGAAEPVAPFGLESRPVLAPLAFPDAPPPPSAVALERAFPALSFARPVFLAAAPDGSSRVYVVEQAGRVLVFDNDDAVSSAATFLDLRAPSGPVSRASNEEGLLGLAFDPAFGPGGSPDVYVYYSAASPRRSVLARYAASFPAGLPPVVDPSSAVVLLQVAQPYPNHNAGMIAFGPDGMLYVALGDGGSADDPQRNGQDPSTLLASLLRLDVRGRTTYAVPTDNPFAGLAGRRGEIWAWGLRNPWRFSFDRDTGDLWLADVGQGEREEVDVIVGGGNYGWPVYEGVLSHQNPAGIPASEFERPVIDYDRSRGSSITGGYVYRGQDVPSLRGAYVYGDYGSGRVWALLREGTSVLSNAEVAGVAQLSSFGEDARGELYAVSLGGSIWRVREPDGGAEPAPFPARLSETGLFVDTASLEPNPGLLAYDVIAPLYSDGAAKRRWLALPNGARIGFASTGAWTFPRGTVLVKHFELETRAGDASSLRRLETRVLILESGGWRGYTYRWNDAQDDADLLPGAFTEVFTVEDPDAPGGVRQQPWTYPSRTDCLRCHTAAAGHVLGLRTLQTNREHDYAGVTDNQLRAFDHVRLFDRTIGDPGSYLALVDPFDPAASLAARARSYLDANCASCHRPVGGAPGDMDLRYTTPDAALHAIDERPTEGDLGLADAWRVRSGEKESSVLWERMRLRGEHQMPPLGSHVADAPAVDLVGAWIDGL